METSKKQQELSERAVSIQQKALERQAPAYRIGFIRILVSDDAGSTKTYPEYGPSEHLTIPLDIWRSMPSHYVTFSVANSGNNPIYVSRIGIGADEKNVAWAQAKKEGQFWCNDRGDPEKYTDCASDIQVNSEVKYTLALDDRVLKYVNKDWQDTGLEVCIEVETIGTDCAKSWASMPHDFAT